MALRIATAIVIVVELVVAAAVLLVLGQAVAQLARAARGAFWRWRRQRRALRRPCSCARPCPVVTSPIRR